MVLYFQACYQYETLQPDNWINEVTTLYLQMATMSKFAATEGREKMDYLRAALCFRCSAIAHAKRYVLNRKVLKKKQADFQKIISEVSNNPDSIQNNKTLEHYKNLTAMCDALDNDINACLSYWKMAADILCEHITPQQISLDDLKYKNLLQINTVQFIGYIKDQMKKLGTKLHVEAEVDWSQELKK